MERIEEKEEVIKGKDFVIQSLLKKMQVFTLRIEEVSELRANERSFSEANEIPELPQNQLAEQEEIVKAFQSALESLEKIRLTEKEQALRHERELRDQLKQKETLLLEKDRTLDRLERQWQDERRAQESAYNTLLDEKRAYEERLQRAETDVETYQSRIRVLEHKIERARETTDIFRGDQPWMISRDEIKLSDKVLGTGAWGRVVEGNFRGTKVAVKEIHEIIQSAHNRLLFDREITFATLVRHPCILQFLAVAEYRTSKPLLVAELMDMSLSQLVRDEKSLGNRFIRILALDVAYGLNYLHCFRPNPIIHRDVNSGNVMVWRQGDKWRGKLCDFGSAEFMGSIMSENPGNPFYSAPEASSSYQSPKVGHSHLYIFI